jgi:hypothetical protein
VSNLSRNKYELGRKSCLTFLQSVRICGYYDKRVGDGNASELNDFQEGIIEDYYSSMRS